MKFIAVWAIVALTFIAHLFSAPVHAETAWVPPGPAIGTAFPNALELKDQAGEQQSLRSLMGKNGVAVFFVRSADWCPFCKRQLIDVNAHLTEFRQLGLGIASISMDTVDKIASFHNAQSIGYTMLSDPDGAIVETMGIRDLQYSDGSKAYGVARPMIFIIDPQLKIMHKYAEESFRNRPDLDKVLSELRAK